MSLRELAKDLGLENLDNKTLNKLKNLNGGVLIKAIRDLKKEKNNKPAGRISLGYGKQFHKGHHNVIWDDMKDHLDAGDLGTLQYK